MNRRSTLAVAIALSASLALAGCSAEPELTVSGAFMPEPVTGSMAAGFLTVTNSGGAADELTSVTSDIAGEVQIHETKNQKMQQVKSLDVPADGELNLERGGNHLMFMNLKQKPEQGEKVSVELHFEKAGPVRVDLPVKETTHNPTKH
ncbi:copper chaperone PCu(A)C [Streptomyces sp. SYSU K217416]